MRVLRVVNQTGHTKQIAKAAEAKSITKLCCVGKIVKTDH